MSSGGGIYSDSYETRIVNCVFSSNASVWGGGLVLYNDAAEVKNCTFGWNNSSYIEGGGIHLGYTATADIANCILWGNTPDQIYQGSISYSDIQGGFAGEGNIDADPLFVQNPDPGPDGQWWTEDDILGDYHLRPGSPCIDAGNNEAVPEDVTTDFNGNPRFVDDPETYDTGLGDPPIVDMGCYEFQVIVCPADVTGDGTVDVLDLLAVLAAWGPCEPDCPEDINGDGIVDVLDLLEVLSAWGPCP